MTTGVPQRPPERAVCHQSTKDISPLLAHVTPPWVRIGWQHLSAKLLPSLRPWSLSGWLAAGDSDSLPVPRAGSQPQAVAEDRDTKEPDKLLEPW